MTALEDRIGQNIRAIAGRMPSAAAVIAGKVVAVNAGAGTCKVELSSDDAGQSTEGVLLNAALGVTAGVILYPAVNSMVWVAAVDGPGKWGVIKCSTLTKVGLLLGDVSGTVENGKVYWKQGAGELTMQGGKLQWKNGSGDLKTGIDNLMTHLLALTVSTAMGPSGTPINAADLTSDKSYFDNLLF